MRLITLLPLGLLLFAIGCDKPAEVTQPPVQVLIGEGSADPAALAAMAQKQALEASGQVGCGGEAQGDGCGGGGCGGGEGSGCGGEEGSCAGADGSGCGGGCGKQEGQCTKGADGKCACEGCKGCGDSTKGDCCCGAGEQATAKPAGAHDGDDMDALENVPADKIKAQPGLTVGDITRCPMSGEVFRIKANSPKSVVDGKTYYLCCKRCVAKFEKNPAKFLAK